MDEERRAAKLAYDRKWHRENQHRRRVYNKKYRASHKEQRRLYNRKYRESRAHKENHWRKHGIIGMTVERHAKMLEEQQGKCKICGEMLTQVCVDHDHATGKVRGLLCQHCNKGIGFFKDSPAMLRTAAAYLEK